jgi:phenylalanyl-tRNA synthetase alpha chain
MGQIDNFTHPKNNRTSLCYRINYRSMDKWVPTQPIPADTHVSCRSLSNEETNALHSGVVSRLKDQFRVEIR